MDINWFETILYGFIAGITEFMPVSSQAHQLILLSLFGESSSHCLLGLFIHIGCISALLLSSGGVFRKLYREYKYSKTPKRRRKREVNMQSVLDIRFIKMACIPFLLSFIIYAKTKQWGTALPLVAAFLLLNGIILYIPMYLSTGNKDSRNMSALDGCLFGLASSLSVLPGVSRIGVGASLCSARGADSQQAFKWCLILSVPGLAGMLCFDFYGIITGSMTGVDVAFVLKCILAGVLSYVGTSLSIGIMKSITAHSGLSGFSYYSWGAALFAFILYLY